MKPSILDTARHTIQIEAQAVAALEHLIAEDFERVVQIINTSSGRVIVSGVGKSAIISQKIVATLNSTGTPAIFMHAADAIHGDLGMIKTDDIVIVVSKSGESPEIKALASLIKSFGNVLIGMVGNVNSFLSKQSNYIINTTVSKEACPNNLAPTSSTTAQMVVGDALAICLMELKRFSGNDFAKIHPGGNLGKRLFLKVTDLYADNLKPRVLATATLKEVIVEMTKKRLGATAVVDEENKVKGIITDGDLRRMLEKSSSLDNVTAEDILTPDPKKINADQLAVNALEALRQHDINQLVVVNERNEYMGLLHLHDLIKEGII